MLRAKQKAKQVKYADSEARVQLAKIKKLINVTNPDSFVLAVQLMSTLDADEDLWVSVLSEHQIKRLFKLKNNAVSNLLFEIATMGLHLKKLVLNSLEKINNSTKRYESPIKKLETLSVNAATGLSAYNGEIDLSSLCKFTLTDDVVIALAKHDGPLTLRGNPAGLSNLAFAALANHRGRINFYDIVKLDNSDEHVALAIKLSRQKGELEMNKLVYLGDRSAEALVKHKGNLRFGILQHLSESTACSLAKHKGLLDLPALKHPSDAVIAALGGHIGNLHLESMEALTEANARALAKHKGALYLDGIVQLSDTAAAELAKFPGWLNLGGLESLSNLSGNVALASKLAKQSRKKKGFEMVWLGGLKNLSEKSAEAFIQYEAWIDLSSLSKFSAQTASALSKNKKAFLLNEKAKKYISECKAVLIRN